MNAEEHLAAAEELLRLAKDAKGPDVYTRTAALAAMATAHASIAAALEAQAMRRASNWS